MASFVAGIQRTRWVDVGPVSVNVYTLAGPWLSAGMHVSVVPLYVDVHIGWWVISVMSRKRGEWIREAEESYEQRGSDES